ncbi:hypothetical protein AVA65_07805 [Salmonella enterica subsp. enterica serovar Minnesota]|nr:hypothetical protein [Salmonella enterica subsp. enterica serovar Minnesota]
MTQQEVLTAIYIRAEIIHKLMMFANLAVQRFPKPMITRLAPMMENCTEWVEYFTRLVHSVQNDWDDTIDTSSDFRSLFSKADLFLLRTGEDLLAVVEAAFAWRRKIISRFYLTIVLFIVAIAFAVITT